MAGGFLGEHFEFWRQFRERFDTTGAVAPSSRFLARALCSHLTKRDRPVRILEIGPGTGAVTKELVQLVRPGDQLDLVELNERFVELLREKFLQEPSFVKIASQSAVHQCPLQEFESTAPYDFVISGLPLNNFPPPLVREIFEAYFRLLAPGGVLSYFEYMYVRSVKKSLSPSEDERQRLHALDEIIQPHLAAHRVRRDWVFANVPPAWVQHLRVKSP